MITVSLMPTDTALAPSCGGLHTVVGAAGYLQTSQRRVWQLLRTGDLAAVRDGRTVKITTAELERFIRDLPSYEPASA
jgi:excisionase family DNA binding protein